MKDEKNSRNSEPLINKKIDDPLIKEKIDALLLILNSPNYKETLQEKIKNLYITEFEDRFHNILTEKAEDFLNNLTLRVGRLLEDLFTGECLNNDSEIFKFKSLKIDIKEMMKKQEEYIKKEKFQPNYKVLSASLLIYESKLLSTSRKSSKSIEFIPYMKNFTRHCKDSCEAIHTCGEKLIEISSGKTSVTLLCVKCKKGYLPSCVLLFCSKCNIEYFSSLSKGDSNLQPATWVKYHCGAIINDQMKCIKCREIFHLNCETSKLECLNSECLLKADPLSIRWKCMICKDEFKSEAKIYNPLEFKKIKNAIKDAIIDRLPARPRTVNCCTEINAKIENFKFFHKKECDGELYLGKMNGKDIVVCERCRSMNFYDKYIWTCPICYKRFQQKFEKIEEKQNFEEKTSNQSESQIDKEKLGNKNNIKLSSDQETPEKSNPNLKRHNSQFKVYDQYSESCKKLPLPMDSAKKNSEKFDNNPLLKSCSSNYIFGQTKPFTAILEEDEDAQKLDNLKVSNKNESITNPQISLKYQRSQTPNLNFESTPKLDSPLSTITKNEVNTSIKQNLISDFKKTNSSNLINLNFSQEKNSVNPLSQVNYINNPISVQGSGNININVNINIKKSLAEEFEKEKLEKKSIQSSKEINSNLKNRAQSPITSSRNKGNPISSSSKLNMANLINLNQNQNINSQNKVTQTSLKEMKSQNSVTPINNSDLPIDNKNITPPLSKKEKKSNFPIDEEESKINKIPLASSNTNTDQVSTNNYQISKINLEDYKVIRQIGEGSYGKIYLVEEIRNKSLFALKKIIAHSRDEIEGFKTEYELMNFIGGTTKDSILRIYGITTKELDITTFALYVLMELADSDWEKEIKLRNQEKRFYSEEELISIINKVVRVFASLQRENISHRDIKPQNILIFYPINEQKQKDRKNPIYKIADFGEAKEVNMKNQQKELNTLRGTELYMSPVLFTSLRNSGKSPNEMIDSESFKITHDSFKSDVFSFGYCVLLAATLNYRALYDIRELGDMQSTSMIIYRYLKSRYSNKLINVIIKMVEINENLRPDFIQLEEKFLV
jgi:hypothetical protein